MNTLDLITHLSQQKPLPRLSPPAYYVWRIGGIWLLYAIVIQSFLNIRADLFTQLTHPLFTFEILLLVFISVTSVIASVLLMYPDFHQQRWALYGPYGAFVGLIGLIVSQFTQEPDSHAWIPTADAHGLGCTLCIASTAFLPSALLFWLMRKGASTHLLRAGSFAVLAASSVACLVLRLSEANDSLAHLALWHYLPTFLFALLGAWTGRMILRW